MNSVTPACEPLVLNVGLICKDEMLQTTLRAGCFSPGVPERYYFFRIFVGSPSVRVVKVEIITKSKQLLAAEGIDVAIRQHRTQVCKASRVRFLEVRAKTVHTNCPDGRWRRKVRHWRYKNPRQQPISHDKGGVRSRQRKSTKRKS